MEPRGRKLPDEAHDSLPFQFGLHALFAVLTMTSALAAIASRGRLCSALFVTAGFAFSGSFWALSKNRRRFAFWLSYFAVLSLLGAIFWRLIDFNR
jgi:hypothetical protein